MKNLFLLIIAILLCFSLSACNLLRDKETYNLKSYESQLQDDNNFAEINYTTFEEACQLSNTVIIANYVKSKPFGEQYIEHEFIVKETIFGNTEDTIYVYTHNVNLSVTLEGKTVTSIPAYNQNNISFLPDLDYLLVLDKRPELYTLTTIYYLISETVVRLDDLSLSEMYDMPIESHAKGIEFTDKTSTTEMISYVKELTKNNTPAHEYIKSNKLEDIAINSQYAAVVKIGKNYKKIRNEFMEHDMYYFTVVHSLKGEIENEPENHSIVFLPNTVDEDEEWIVFLERENEHSYHYTLTSKNSLVPYNRKDEVLKVINGS